jgi:uncharacterized membrane protein YccC
MAAIGALITLLAAGAFALAGYTMVSLRSESGNTVAEAFDQAMGIFSFGMAGLVLLGGLAVDRLIAINTKPATGDPGLAGWNQKPSDG